MRRAAAITAALAVFAAALVLAAARDDAGAGYGQPSLSARLDDVVAAGVPGVLVVSSTDGARFAWREAWRTGRRAPSFA